MKAHLAGLGMMLALVSTVARADELKEFTSEAGRFSVKLPATPMERMVGPQTMYLLAEGANAYIVTFMDVPALDGADEAAIRKSLEDGRDKAVAALKGMNMTSKPIKLDGATALEFQMEVGGAGIYRSRLYQVKERLYQVTSLGPGDFSTSPATEQVFESFTLKK